MTRKKTILRKWLVNTLAIILTLLVVLSISVLVFMKDYYYRSVEKTMINSLENVNTYFQMRVNQSGSDDAVNLYDSIARDLLDAHEKKESIELQLIDMNGKVIISSTGFDVSDLDVVNIDNPEPDDTGYLQVVIGKNYTGENALSVLAPIYSQQGKIFGYARMISSLKYVDAQLMNVGLILVFMCIAVVLTILLSSSYFVNSIVRPITEINKTARQIALGDYDVRVEKRSNDEIGALSDAINYMAQEIAATEDMKNDFISSVSHELRTPLTAIKGWAETLQSDSEAGTLDEEFTKKGLDVIIGEVERLSTIVEDLLDFSRMQSGRISLVMDTVDIVAELSEAVLLYEERAKRQGTEIVYVEPENSPAVVGDKDRLRQVFINIIDNGIKYTPDGGKLRVETAVMDKMIQIVVSDTGMGIPKDELSNVKEKFYRVNHSLPGSGIGLALADDIVKRHKGRLDIDSEEGVGTTVTIMLPIA